jgi:hypothetical protein
MWKPEHRLAADRSGLRYPSDLTDCEWTIVSTSLSRSFRFTGQMPNGVVVSLKWDNVGDLEARRTGRHWQ